jgi:hypothetical protein
VTKSRYGVIQGHVLEKTRLTGVDDAVHELVSALHWAVRELQDATLPGEDGWRRELEMERAAVELKVIAEQLLTSLRNLEFNAHRAWDLVTNQLVNNDGNA